MSTAPLLLCEEGFVPEMPPGEDDLPYDFGEPLESLEHWMQNKLLVDTLNLHLAFSDDTFIGTNMAIYYSLEQVKTNDFRGPDVFVVLDTVRRAHKSWVVWQEGKAPDVVIEVLSPKTRVVDRGEKKVIYARKMRVPEYFLFDPQTHALEGHTLQSDRRGYRAMRKNADGSYTSAVLKLKLGLWEGMFDGIHRVWARWYTLEGRLLPTPDENRQTAEQARDEAEQARDEAEQARDEAQQARDEAQRARDEAERAARAEAEARRQAEAELQALREQLAALKARVGHGS